MAKKMSRSMNRIISLLCLSFFVVAVASCGITLTMIGIEYVKNQELEAKLAAEMAYLDEIYSNVDDDGYYNVYSDGNYVVYGNGGSIIIEK